MFKTQSKEAERHTLLKRAQAFLFFILMSVMQHVAVFKKCERQNKNVLTRHLHPSSHCQADLTVASGCVHQVYYVFVWFPSNHIFIHRNELVSRSKSSITLSGSVLYYSTNNNLFETIDISSIDEGEEEETVTVQSK